MNEAANPRKRVSEVRITEEPSKRPRLSEGLSDASESETSAASETSEAERAAEQVTREKELLSKASPKDREVVDLLVQLKNANTSETLINPATELVQSLLVSLPSVCLTSKPYPSRNYGDHERNPKLTKYRLRLILDMSRVCSPLRQDP
jgi:hypothetical protein